MSIQKLLYNSKKLSEPIIFHHQLQQLREIFNLATDRNCSQTQWEMILNWRPLDYQVIYMIKAWGSPFGNPHLINKTKAHNFLLQFIRSPLFYLVELSKNIPTIRLRSVSYDSAHRNCHPCTTAHFFHLSYGVQTPSFGQTTDRHFTTFLPNRVRILLRTTAPTNFFLRLRKVFSRDYSKAPI